MDSSMLNIIYNDILVINLAENLDASSTFIATRSTSIAASWCYNWRRLRDTKSPSQMSVSASTTMVTSTWSTLKCATCLSTL